MLVAIPDDHCLYVKYILSIHYTEVLEYATKLQHLITLPISANLHSCYSPPSTR